MIKISLTGAGSLDGGELIRLLAIHPDVELISVSAPGLEGKAVTSVHHGLIGETSLNFSARPDLERTDMLFVCDNNLGVDDFKLIREKYPEMKIILLEPIAGSDGEDLQIVYGLPEIYRKQLVRGAQVARVPVSFASMALVALFPFANNLMLTGDIDIDVTAPKAIIDTVNIKQLEEEIASVLSEVQTSFTGKVNLKATPSNSRRSALMRISFAGSHNLEQMLELYDIYDDHRFAFVTQQPVGVSEVAGTDKCVVTVFKPEEGKVVLGATADCRMRGGAGEAVHIMNLMWGLHEKTGLALKAIDFESIDC
ncbi:MAG: hypothetical protein K2M87_02840 [Muribaculaceae bacterium]|nr:hypothetical protein [Muribaculaceae bacterium]